MRRSAPSLVGCSKSAVSSSVRSAQTTEVFREAFYRYSNSSINVTISDLDQLISSEKIRPSLLLPIYETCGVGLGLVCKLAPNSVSQLLSEVVASATTLQLNDSIRNMSLEPGNDNEDVKETLKFHRDIGDLSAASSQQNQATSGAQSSPRGSRVQGVLSTGIYGLLKVSETI